MGKKRGLLKSIGYELKQSYWDLGVGFRWLFAREPSDPVVKELGNAALHMSSTDSETAARIITI